MITADVCVTVTDVRLQPSEAVVNIYAERTATSDLEDSKEKIYERDIEDPTG